MTKRQMTWRGQDPLKLPDGETRKWLEDGDTLTIAGWCVGNGYRVGFGEVAGKSYRRDACSRAGEIIFLTGRTTET